MKHLVLVFWDDLLRNTTEGHLISVSPQCFFKSLCCMFLPISEAFSVPLFIPKFSEIQSFILSISSRIWYFSDKRVPSMSCSPEGATLLTKWVHIAQPRGSKSLVCIHAEKLRAKLVHQNDRNGSRCLSEELRKDCLTDSINLSLVISAFPLVILKWFYHLPPP